MNKEKEIYELLPSEPVDVAAITMFDTMNNMQSNRMDGVE